MNLPAGDSARFSRNGDGSKHPLDSTAIRVVIADSTEVGAGALASELDEDSEIKVVAAVAGKDKTSQAVDALQPEVVLISQSLDDEKVSGLELSGQLHRQTPTMRIVILLGSSSAEAVVGAFRAGACGVLVRDGSPDALRKCIVSVHRGQIWADSQQIHFVLDAFASNSHGASDGHSGSSSTALDREVIDLATSGHTDIEIAQLLEISEAAVKHHISNTFEKLGISSRIELAFGSVDGSKQMSMGRRIVATNMQWLEELAEKGSGSARTLLAELHHHGATVTQDRVSAYRWYLVAQQADIGQRTEMARRQLAKEMTPAELAQAESRAAAWLEQCGKLARRAEPRPSGVLAEENKTQSRDRVGW
jgi:DNA-binding NarL/FixJ family response regulator